jgi:membrane-bound lytic murein transglycosylase F
MTRTAISIIAIGALLAGCSEPPSTLDQIREAGELRVGTLNSPNTYYMGPEGPAGFEYDLLRGFADDLDVALRIVVPPTRDNLYERVRRGQIDLAAGHLPVPPEAVAGVTYGPSYLILDRYVVYRRGTPRPADVADLLGREVHVRAGTGIEQQFRTLRPSYGDVRWRSHEDLNGTDLVAMVAGGMIDYAVVQSTTFQLAQRLYPEAAVAFVLGDPVALAWAFRANADDSLQKAVAVYLQEIGASGEFTRLWDRHYGHAEHFDYVDARTFLRHYEQRLIELRPAFEAAAQTHGLDWRLLAAVGYQESHWNANALSPTGVRGLMMLTAATANALGADRSDPHASIEAGARYLAELHARIPERIAEPDRTWMALAAYNIGFGHLEDARVLTERQGHDPDRWIDVARHLRVLSDPNWYKHTKHGFARGGAPIEYVRNIRRYYEVLVWLDGKTVPPHEILLAAEDIRSPIL